LILESRISTSWVINYVITTSPVALDGGHEVMDLSSIQVMDQIILFWIDRLQLFQFLYRWSTSFNGFGLLGDKVGLGELTGAKTAFI